MKIKHLLPLLASIILILILVATSCTPTTTQPGATSTKAQPTVTVTVTPTSTAAAKDKTYRAMNPAGFFIPVQTKPLVARLDTIDGKTLYVCQGEADPVIMPALYKRLVKDYPKTKFIYYDRADFGPSVPGTGGGSSTTGLNEDPDILKKVQAVIRGIGW